MTFVHPWLLVLALPLAFAAWRLLRYGRRSGVRFAAVGRLPVRASSWRSLVAAVSPYVLLAGLALLVVAAARPQRPLGTHVRYESVEAISIMMTADVSGSMWGLDLAPESFLREYPVGTAIRTTADLKKVLRHTRLGEVKRMFARFVDRRPCDPIGLVTFGTNAETRSPLTTDHKALNAIIGDVEVPLSECQTAIGDGLAMALARLEKAATETKIVILLSDGDNNSGIVDPDEAAAIAARRGIKVYAIGVGSDGGKAHPRLMASAFGYGILQSDESFDEGQLKSIATKTGGMYFSVNDTQGLEAALAEIDRLEKTPIETIERQLYQELFGIPLATGVALTLLAVAASLLAARRMA